MVINPALYKLVHPKELTHIRVTSFRTFEECPFTWMIQNLLRVDETKCIPLPVPISGKYAMIGTAVHKIVEIHLMQLFDLYPEDYVEEDMSVNWALIPKDEQTKLLDYLEVLSEYHDIGYKLLGLEQEIEIRVPGVDCIIRGHLDAILESPSKGILILDHKTDRQYHDREWWSKQLQQLIYTYMIRTNYPDAHTIWFAIGYPNQGTKVEWETSPEDDDALHIRLQSIWKRMLEYAQTNEWPKFINDKCGWCPIRNECEVAKRAINRFQESFIDMVEPKSLGEQLEFVKQVQKLVEAKREELEQLIAIDIVNIPGHKLRQGNNIWYLETESKRAIDIKTTFDLITQQISEYPELKPIVMDMLPDLFTVKVTGIDKLVKKTKGAFTALTDAMVKQPNSKSTLKCMPAGKLSVDDKMKFLTQNTNEGDA